MQLSGGLYDSSSAGLSVLWTASPLARFIVNDNQLTGPVPTEIGLVSTFQVVDLSRNQFTGALPDRASTHTHTQLHTHTPTHTH